MPEEGPPTLGLTKTVSKCIVAAATANKNAYKAHKATNTNFTNGKPLSNKFPPSSLINKTQQQSTHEVNCPEIIMEEHERQQEYNQRYIYDNEDDDILKELETTSPKRNHNVLTVPQPDCSKYNHNGKTSPIKLKTQMPTPPPPSPRLSSDCNNSNMKREIVNEDGSKDIWYPNGNLKKISADGMLIRMLYYNKDIKETNINEGTVRYYYAETNTWHTTYLDGLEILEFPSGQVEHRHKNGIVEVHYPNNSIKIVDPKDEHKEEEWRFPDGTHLLQMRNGDKILSLPNGQKEIHNKLHKRREYPDGTVKIVYPDGSTETRYSNGRIRLKDKDGKLVMDTDLSK